MEVEAVDFITGLQTTQELSSVIVCNQLSQLLPKVILHNDVENAIIVVQVMDATSSAGRLTCSPITQSISETNTKSLIHLMLDKGFLTLLITVGTNKYLHLVPYRETTCCLSRLNLVIISEAREFACLSLHASSFI